MSMMLALLALAFLIGVGTTGLLSRLARPRVGGTDEIADVETVTVTTNLLHVVKLSDWTVEGLKSLWLHCRLGPSRTLKTLDLEQGLAQHMGSHGIEMAVIAQETRPKRHVE